MSEQRRKHCRVIITGVACALLAGAPAWPLIAWAKETASQEEDKKQAGEEINTYDLPEITVEAKRPDWESKLSPGTVTVIRPDDYKGEQKSLPELLKQVPGVHVRDVNGKGQYTTVSVRGSTAAQVGVFIDGVLCNLGGDAAVDISTIPVENVERIEVYRGYIPARFGGTFMGGVINIVTKKPTKTNITASVGQSSYGGYKGNLQVDAPLGSGSLMFGLNRDESDGDFKYKNSYADASAYAYYTAQMTQMENFSSSALKLRLDRMVALLNAQGLTTLSAYSSLTAANVQYTLLTNSAFYTSLTAASSQLQALAVAYAAAGDTANANLYSSRASYLSSFTATLSTYETYKKGAAANKSADRWRKSNDYKNTDAILKWQDEHWFAKATWKEIDRHYPWQIDVNGNVYVDVVDDPYYSHRRQKLTNTEFLGGRRDTVGNLEWGWSADYLKQQKRYEVDNWQTLSSGVDYYWVQPGGWWSEYNSDRWGGKLDGTYKAGKKHLIEFMVDGSKETMDCTGWHLDSIASSSNTDIIRRYRNHYEQTIFNAQMQDTITLNQQADLWLTPSVRYNQSTIYGLSKYYNRQNDPQHFNWLRQADEQTDGKATWQLALKKKVNDELTLRATGGTYFRLLNMYEIAGDGAGILPMPNVGSNGTQSVFPQPEEGTQWDLSAIYEKPLLGARSSKLQLTYFHRNSEKMLQLGSWNRGFFVYTNAASAKIDGTELQWNLSWKKWDADLEGTYMHAKDVIFDMSALPGAGYWQNNGVFSGFLTYTPEWEGVARLTYRPDTRLALFGQWHYTGEMSTSIYNQAETAVQSSLQTIDIGMKYKPIKDLQVSLGVNDVFDAAQDLRESNLFDHTSKTLLYPQQGRTYYATVQYSF